MDFGITTTCIVYFAYIRQAEKEGRKAPLHLPTLFVREECTRNATRVVFRSAVASVDERMTGKTTTPCVSVIHFARI